MPALTLDGYHGPVIPDRILSFLGLLESHSIDVVVTGSAGKTIRLLCSGKKLGYVNGAVIRRGALFGYHFAEPAPGSDSCPKATEAVLIPLLCEQFECEPAHVDSYEETGSNSGRTFLLFREPNSALRALRIRAGLSIEPEVVIASVDSRFVEGRVIETVVHVRERDRAAREKCLSVYGFSCIACGVNLKNIYRGLPTEVIHVHHEEPMYLNPGEREFDPVKTLKPICPNCHCVAHARNPPYTISELQEMLRAEA